MIWIRTTLLVTQQGTVIYEYQIEEGSLGEFLRTSSRVDVQFLYQERPSTLAQLCETFGLPPSRIRLRDYAGSSVSCDVLPN